jgi:hypothetical protein
MKWNRFGRKLYWPNQGIILPFDWRNRGKPYRISVRIATSRLRLELITSSIFILECAASCSYLIFTTSCTLHQDSGLSGSWHSVLTPILKVIPQAAVLRLCLNLVMQMSSPPATLAIQEDCIAEENISPSRCRHRKKGSHVMHHTCRILSQIV